MRPGPSCGTCRFAQVGIATADAAGESTASHPVMLCWRYPPIVYWDGAESRCVRPQVDDTEFCGEWQPPEPEYAGTGGEQ